MKITRSTTSTMQGPEAWFTGNVYVDSIAAAGDGNTINASLVHFTPGARTAWHTHPHGQTIYITEGAGLCQRRGGPVIALFPGDRVYFEPNEEHWHGATADRFMVHIAMLQVGDDGATADWGDQVTDEDYGIE